MNPPIVIIGAGRSGTNMLRDILVQLPGMGTWPCDEINYIWRHGNRDFETDCFTRAMATPQIGRFVHKEFDKISRNHNIETVVEKTCANSLRVGFVDEILPQARFIQIVRDGRDVAVSAAKRWNAKLDIGYLMKKARYVPKSDLFYYGSRYLSNRIYRIVSGKRRLSVWGPKFPGMQQVYTENPLEVGCAIQWEACVSSSEEEFSNIDPARVCNLKYEEFTAEPIPTLLRISSFIGAELNEKAAADLVSGVSDRSVGSWKNSLSSEVVAGIENAIGDSLRKFGYE